MKRIAVQVVGSLALLMAAAGAAEAQFTTVVTPPPAKRAAQAAAQERREQAITDSVARVAVVDMKAWVDSAAQALAASPDTTAVAAATTATARPPAVQPTQADSAARRAVSGGDTETFHEGAPAPNTATPYPAVALGGVVLMLAGLGLRRRSARARA
jgi:hypothetical protein